MKTISIFDTSISDFNLGNQIIMDGVRQWLTKIFPDSFFYSLPCQEITKHTIKCINSSDFVIFGGTNSLSGEMEKYKQWDINLCKSIKIKKKVILMGIGWWQYQKNISLYTKLILNNVLNKNYKHSSRDNYTKEKLSGMGYSVLNTGCPTLWGLNEAHCRQINGSKQDKVILTFTDYRQDKNRDRKILDILLNNYKQIYYWIQGVGDYDYIKNLGIDKKIKIINPSLIDFDRILESENLDYVGTRLHAGIRALQKKRRAFILGIDNRSLEMKKDFDLPVIMENDIEEEIYKKYLAKIKLPEEEIKSWINQFK